MTSSTPLAPPIVESSVGGQRRQGCPLEPYLDRVVLLLVDEDHTTLDKGDGTTIRLELPQDQRPVSLRGEVIAVGPGILRADGARVPMYVQIGDMVTFTRSAGYEISVNMRSFLVVPQAQCLTKLVLEELR
jgi:chaperonin GroES